MKNCTAAATKLRLDVRFDPCKKIKSDDCHNTKTDESLRNKPLNYENIQT